MSNNNVIGITGGIGCGKSTVTELFKHYGIAIIDADIVAREVVEPASPALHSIAEKFGSEILLEDGSLNRAKLRGLIFSRPADKSWLENLLHPIIRSEILCQLHSAAASDRYTILSSPLLLETDQHLLCKQVIAIDLALETQIARAMSRDNNTREQIVKIINNQLSNELRCAKADIIIDNNHSLTDLARQVSKIHLDLLVKTNL
ncbi:MAG: dephospho-CoA kinase [Pseudomonadales bacterium]|nr:dephospho-CoA kinase [Pseudomonadales bacterium]NRA16356.1 dephospho-CoA kinase [Oceanospirillaceae bacterium]